ncbi:MAG: DUF1587 domain-containing protein, partial [Myxococcota bacterium]|nr:DUF1587 domain-containing protein [Myxococcota bacterium]
MRDLFRLDTPTGLSSTFIGDPPGTGFSTDTEHLDVLPDLWHDYQRASEEVAHLVAQSPEHLAAILPPGLTGSGRSRDPSRNVVTLDEPCLAEAALEAMQSCCEGAGTCVPKFVLPPDTRPYLTDCGGGSMCIPETGLWLLQNGGVFIPQPCTSVASKSPGGVDGTCLPSCLPKVQNYAWFLSQDVCAADELCAPCIDPLTGEATGACGFELFCFIRMAEFDASRDAFLTHFGRRIFRRPLDEAELERYGLLFDQWRERAAMLVVETPDSFATGFAAGVE